MQRKIWIAILAALAAGLPAGAQSLSGKDLQDQLLRDWTRAKKYTDAYLDAVPADKYGFKAVDSLRSFADQMLHLASGNVFLVSKVTTLTPLPALTTNLDTQTARSKDSVRYYVDASYDYCIKVIQSLPPDSYGDHVQLFRFNVTKYALLLKAFEHQTHHRGQTTTYIRLMNIIPPGERLFEE